MKYADVEYVSGHKLVDNGVGDYDLECPVQGNLGFAHMGTVAMMASDWRCIGCGEAIGLPTEGSPRPYTRA